jgi:hypothetical protein
MFDDGVFVYSFSTFRTIRPESGDIQRHWCDRRWVNCCHPYIAGRLVRDKAVARASDTLTSCPTVQQSRRQITGDKIASATD